MEWIRGTGELGRLIFASSAGVIIAGVVAAYVRAARNITTGLLILSLLPVTLAGVGAFSGVASWFGQDHPIMAPSPKDLAADFHYRNCLLLLGSAGTALCLVATAVAYVRSPRPDESIAEDDARG